jgi:maltose alpha-D-glucosyltransferase/alpha-amylase
MTEVYLQSYTGAMTNSNLVPPVANDFRTLLRLYLLDKALYELRYELNNRPDWVIIPVTGLISTIQEWMESGVHHA